MRNNQNGRMKITQTENETHLVDEYGEVTESSDCKNLFRVIQSIQNAEFPENIAAQDWVIIENSGIKEIAADLRANNDELDKSFAGFKKRLKNAVETNRLQIIKERDLILKKMEVETAKIRKGELKREADKKELEMKKEEVKNEKVKKVLFAINTDLIFNKVKKRNYRRQTLLFKLKEIIE